MSKSSLLRTTTQEQLTAFIANAKGNTSLQERLKVAADINAVASIAKEAGFGISTDDLNNKAQTEISEGDLEGAAGGRIVCVSFGILFIRRGKLS
ncbi:Nif11-like leader peptide family natural product precursor [Synechococcus sp. MIT S9504]|uniref:Nif11-like leader peptide family natural product precursor n=1 Tax=Synechococcus sp. MIT S9504 TaxID=1801628 RepID=UPI0009409E2C|nr:Nif11-like leader peptide family natural product precursor [Synechococcus sp. MIT S9504]